MAEESRNPNVSARASSPDAASHVDSSQCQRSRGSRPTCHVGYPPADGSTCPHVRELELRVASITDELVRMRQTQMMHGVRLTGQGERLILLETSR